MRKNIYRHPVEQTCRIAILDDEIGIIETVAIILKHMGYQCTGFTNQKEAIDAIRGGAYDLLILDYLMEGMHGNEVVSEIRKFNKELYILLLTGHKDVAPPIETLKELDIQAYCEKSDRFDQMILLIESGVKSVNQYKMIKKYRDGFDRILKAVPKIYQLQPIDGIMEEILKGIIPIANSHNAFILIDDLGQDVFGGHRGIFRGIGKYNVGIGEFASMLDPRLMEQIGQVRSTGVCSMSSHECIYPLINEQSELLGIMYVEESEAEEGRKLCEIYAIQAASSISNAFMHSLVHLKHEELNKAYDTLRQRYIEIVDALRRAVDAKHNESLGHSDRVERIALALAKLLGLDELQTSRLSQGAKLHDIGKIGVSDSLLAKPNDLEPMEEEDYFAHAVKGANILSAVSMFNSVVPIVRYHHEWFDGTGYPGSLIGEAIPLEARVVHLADAMDHWMCEATAAARRDSRQMASFLTDGRGTRFDPSLVDMLLNASDAWEKFADMYV